jgi:hypothetical protein
MESLPVRAPALASATSSNQSKFVGRRLQSAGRCRPPQGWHLKHSNPLASSRWSDRFVPWRCAIVVNAGVSRAGLTFGSSAFALRDLKQSACASTRTSQSSRSAARSACAHRNSGPNGLIAPDGFPASLRVDGARPQGEHSDRRSRHTTMLWPCPISVATGVKRPISP